MKYIKVFTDFVGDMEPLSDAERGRLFTAMLQYAELGTEPEFRGNERFIWPAAKHKIDRDRGTYRNICDRNAKIAANRSHEMAPDAAKSDEIHHLVQDKDKDKDKDKDEYGGSPRTPPRADSPPKMRKAYGEYGWIRLTDTEHDRLVADLGSAEFDRCVAYLDELAQSSGNKNRWSDWNLVLRRCHREGWGIRVGTASAAQAPGPLDAIILRQFLEGEP